MSLFYFFIALSFALFYYKRYKDLLHPNLVFLFIWFTAASIGSINYEDFMRPWCIEMHIVVISSGLAFFIGSLVFNKKNIYLPSAYPRIKIPKTFRKIIYLFILISFSCFIIEWKQGGSYLHSFEKTVVGDVKSSSIEAIPFIHYGTILLPYLSIFLMFFLFNENRAKIIDILLILMSISISLLVNISRGELIIYLFAFFFLFSRYKKIKLKHIIIVLIFFLFIIVGLMIVRVNNESVIFTMTGNRYFSIFYSYIATCFANLNDLIIADLPYHLLGDATLAPIWTLMGIKDEFKIIEFNQLDIFNARTYLYQFYYDYKIFGIIFFPFIFGICLSFLYQYSNKKLYYLILLSILQKAIYTPFFGNYFTGEFIIMFPYLFSLIIIQFIYLIPNINKMYKVNHNCQTNLI